MVNIWFNIESGNHNIKKDNIIPTEKKVIPEGLVSKTNKSIEKEDEARISEVITSASSITWLNSRKLSKYKEGREGSWFKWTVNSWK